MSIPWESHAEGEKEMRKKNSTDPGFGMGVTRKRSFLEGTPGELRQLHQGSQGQAGGWMPNPAHRRNPHAKQGQRDYRGEQGLLARVEMGRAQPWSAPRLTWRKCHQTGSPR